MALFLKIQTGPDTYLLEAARVERVIPPLQVRRIPGTAPGVAGVVSYGGTPVPVLDLCELFIGRPAQRQISTRLIVVQVPNAAPARVVGLLAEQVIDTIRLAPEDFVPGIQGRHTRYLGSMANTEAGFAQRIALDELLSTARLQQLFETTGSTP